MLFILIFNSSTLLNSVSSLLTFMRQVLSYIPQMDISLIKHSKLLLTIEPTFMEDQLKIELDSLEMLSLLLLKQLEPRRPVLDYHLILNSKE